MISGQLSLFDVFSPVPAIGSIVHGYTDLMGIPNRGEHIQWKDFQRMSEGVRVLQDLSDHHELKYKVLKFVRTASQEELGDMVDCRLWVSDGNKTKMVPYVRNCNSSLYDGWFFLPDKWMNREFSRS